MSFPPSKNAAARRLSVKPFESKTSWMYYSGCRQSNTIRAEMQRGNGAYGAFAGLDADEVFGGAAGREAALCIGIRAQIHVWHLCAVVAHRSTVHPRHRIAEEARLECIMKGLKFRHCLNMELGMLLALTAAMAKKLIVALTCSASGNTD